jgi:6-phosphofructokinase 1
MAIYYANVIMNMIADGISKVMAAHRDGVFVSTDIPGKDLTPRCVDPADYHPTCYRSCFEHVKGTYHPARS